MATWSRADRAVLEELSEELGTLREGAPPILETFLGRLRDALGVEVGSSIDDLSALVKAGSLNSLQLLRFGGAGLSTLRGLTNVVYYLVLEQTSLTTLDGLQDLTSLQTLWIRDNDQLTTLAGLDNVDSLGSLEIYEHALLKQCEALAFHQDLVDNHGFTGSASIQNNAAGICP